MQTKSSSIVVPKFSNTGFHTQLDESCQHIIALADCTQILIQNIHKQPEHLEDIYSIQNPKTRHVEVTRNTLSELSKKPSYQNA